VPTWNFVAVHAAGRACVVDEATSVRALLARTAAVYEAGAEAPWTVADHAEHVESRLRGIVAFEIPIETLEGKRKLSQNVSDADRAGVIAALRAQGDADSCAIAGAMEALA
jgi:transcriptional regulator